MTVRDWDVKTDGAVPTVGLVRKGFMPTKPVRIEDEQGVWYGLSDGKVNVPVALVAKSQAWLDSEVARKPAAEAALKAIVDTRTASDGFKAQIDAAVLLDDAAWAKLSDREALDHLRKICLGSLGLQLNKPALVAKANDALAAAAAVALDVPSDIGPALEVKP